MSSIPWMFYFKIIFPISNFMFNFFHYRRNHTALADAISHRRKHQENSEKYEQLTNVIETLVNHIKKLLAEENNHPNEKLLVSFYDTNKTELFSRLKDGRSSEIVSSVGKKCLDFFVI